MWLVTTNDNTPAQQFYEKCGMKCVEVRKGEIESARKIKPEIPATGIGGVPIEDEWVYEMRLDAASGATGKEEGPDDAATR